MQVRLLSKFRDDLADDLADDRILASDDLRSQFDDLGDDLICFLMTSVMTSEPVLMTSSVRRAYAGRAPGVRRGRFCDTTNLSPVFSM